MNRERLYRLTGEGLLLLLNQRTEFQIDGLENIPQDQPVILVFNHPSTAARYSFLGLAAVIASYPRKISDIVSMTSSKYESRIRGKALDWGERMGIKRIVVKEDDREIPIPLGLIKAKKFLEQGKTIVISPEGKGEPEAAMGEAKLGAAWLALKTGVSILPIGIEFENNCGLKEFLTDKKKLFVKIGQVINFEKISRPTKEELQQTTKKIMTQIAQLLPPEMRGQYQNGKIES
jgi:1-acyl-sn-glycerol-3-phosphate acyltransferase